MANVAPKASARWRVAIVDDHERSRAAVRAAVWAAGGEVGGAVARCLDAIPMVTRVHPDVVIVAVGLPDGDGVAIASEITQSAGCPVVLLTSHTRDDLVARVASGLAAKALPRVRIPRPKRNWMSTGAEPRP